MKKIFGIILAGIAAFSLFLGVKSVAIELPKTLKQLDETVWLESGQYDPANEGKAVTMLFDPETLGNAVDTDFGIEFTTPAVKRTVDEFVYDEPSKAWKWLPTFGREDVPLQDASFMGSNQASEVLVLDDAFKDEMPSGDPITSDYMTEESLNALGSEWILTTDQGISYVTNAAEHCFAKEMENDGYSEIYEPYVGCVRVQYSATFTDTESKAAITGIQKGKALVLWDEYTGSPVEDDTFGDITSKEALKSTTKKGAMAGLCLMVLVAIVLL